MKEIKDMAKQMREEIDGAKNYAKKALLAKQDGDTVSGKMYYDMANDELRHATNIHGMAVKMIEEKRKTLTPPQYMLDMWKEEHDKYIEKIAKVKYILAEYVK